VSSSFHRHPLQTFPRVTTAALLAAVLSAAPRSGQTQAAPIAERAVLLTQAEQALNEGRPFRASRLLAPMLASPAGRDPATLLLAARAAARWEGWGSVVRLLVGQAWLDDMSGGEGRALLARARVERSEPAVEDARRAVAAARSATLGPRLITLARAFDRANLLDSAAMAYLQAEKLLPAVGDWLRLRAAGVLADSTARSALYRSVSQPAALPRVRWTEALACDRAGDWREAARLYEALGASLAAIRVRLGAPQIPEERAAARRQLVALLTPRLSAEDSRGAIALLDDAFPNLTPDEELLVARRAGAVELARAANGFARAVRAKSLSEQDKLTYASVLARLGRHHEAIALLNTIRSWELRLQAQYLRARSLLVSGTRREAISALRQVVREPQGDSATAATAGFLLGDLLVDQGDEAAARRAYLDVAHRFPRSGFGARAALQAALLAWVHGNRALAAGEFAALAARAGETSEGIAGLYWSGRAALAAGDSLAAASRWHSLLERFPNSYYTVPAAERLGVSPVREPPPGLIAAPDSSLTAALDRAALLEQLGLRVEARFEYDLLSRQAESTPGMLFPAARAFFERGQIARTYRLALRVSEAAPQRLAFPLPPAPALEEARQAGVDPLLVAALIRQESGFDPFARSRADARGLMQVLPSLGAGMAPGAGLLDWEPALLYQPEINARFGVIHLAQTLRKYPKLPAALAAYNAGERPANQWLAFPGAADDPEVFIERIQFAETRDYVRRVLRNLAVYRALYPPIS
jgi:soluble lytic murein transglycosylase